MYNKQFNADNWHRDAKSIAIRNSIRERRWGMRVTVFTNPIDPTLIGDYVLEYNQASTSLQDNANWLKVADIGATWGGGGGVTGADNGLHLDGTNAYLGGTLVEPVQISGDDTYGITFPFMTQFQATSGTGDILGFTETGDGEFQINTGNLNITTITGAINVFAPDNAGINLNLVGNTAFINLINSEFIIGATNGGNISAPSGTLQLNNVGPNPALLYDQFLAADMTWHVPDSLWNGGGWASIEGGTGLYNFDGPTMIYGGSPLPGNAFGFSFYSAAPQQSTTNATLFITQGGAPSEQGLAGNTYNAASIQWRSDGPLHLWSNTVIDFAGDTSSGAANPVITLAGVTAPNATDYIGGDGQWHTAGGGGVTADNGITLTGSNLQLGGTLIQTTTIDGNAGTWGILFDQVSAFNAITPDGSELSITNGGAILVSSASAIDFSLAGGGDPVFLLNGISAPNATDYIGGDGEWHTAGGSYTSDNGITLTSTNFKWGGQLDAGSTTGIYASDNTSLTTNINFGSTGSFTQRRLGSFNVYAGIGENFYAGDISGTYSAILNNPSTVAIQNRVTATNNTTSHIMELSQRTTGTVANNFGYRFVWGLPRTGAGVAAFVTELKTIDITAPGSFQMNIGFGQDANNTVSNANTIQSFNDTNRTTAFFTNDTSFGGGVQVMKIGNATTPASALVADSILLWAQDTSDSTSSLALFTEQAVAAIGVTVPTTKLKINVNGTEYYLLLSTI